MTFRDSRQAHHEREKAELRDKLAAEQAESEQLSKEVERLRKLAIIQDSDAERVFLKEVNAKARWDKLSDFGQGIKYLVMLPFVILREMFLGIGKIFSALPIQAWIVGGILVLSVGMCVYHEFYDPRDGYITGKDYHPPYTTTSCDSNGQNCSTTYHPATWSVDINFQGNGATWEVSHGEYDRLSHGEWYCARDFLHDAPCVRNQPAEQ